MSTSLKLLVATLAVSQISGAKTERESLRRNLRRETTVAQADKNEERQMQFMFGNEDRDGVFGGGGVKSGNLVQSTGSIDAGMQFDDLFELPSAVANVGTGEDDFFINNPTGGFGSNFGAEGGTAGGEGRLGLRQNTPKIGKDSKLGGDNEKMGKAGKIGKMMWDEAPVMAKGSKTDKGLNGKGSKAGLLAPKAGKTNYYQSGGYSRGYSKGGKTGKGSYNGGYSSQSRTAGAGASTSANANNPFDAAGSDDWLSGFSQTESVGYSDLFQPNSDHDVHRNDDYFAGAAPRADMSFGGRMDDGEPIQGRIYDDDYFQVDPQIVFMPRPVVTIAGSVFSANPGITVAPMVPDGSGNTQSLGTEFLFNEIMTDAQNIQSQLVNIEVDNEMVRFLVALDGVCNRIGAQDQNSVQGYCFLTYTFIDNASQLVSGSFTAQGIIVNSEVPGQLTITGGTGVMTGATGLVEILPADVDAAINPPLLIQPAIGSDPFTGVVGWAHFFEFDVDIMFFLPELYAQ